MTAIPTPWPVKGARKRCRSAHLCVLVSARRIQGDIFAGWMVRGCGEAAGEEGSKSTGEGEGESERGGEGEGEEGEVE